MSAGLNNAFQSTVDSFGPAPLPSSRTILVGIDGSDTAMRATAAEIRKMCAVASP